MTSHETIDPALVVEASSPADVRAAVTEARDRDLSIAVWATGHGSHVPADGALLLKTARMSGVLVDPDRRVARVGPGARWADVIAAAAPFGLAPLSGTAPSVGVAGYTLGGGFGLLSRKFGFAADSLLRADLVTADGEQVSVGRDREPELFWALRGGGGNFGVVTGLEFRLHPVTRVHTGTVRFPAARAAETLACFRDWAPRQPDELSTAIILDGGPTFSVKVLSIDDPRRALRPLWTVAGRPVEEDLRTVPYAEVALPSVPPMGFHAFRALPDELIERLAGLGTAVEVRYWGGAMARPAGDAGPIGHRDAPFSVAVRGSASALRPYAAGTFLNFLHDPAEVETAYTPENFQRLRAVKRAHDPRNVFRRNHNIPPARSEIPAARQPALIGAGAGL